jgi:hypothetical protein
MRVVWGFKNVLDVCEIKKLRTSRRMRWAGHVARMGRRGMLIDYWRERDH